MHIDELETPVPVVDIDCMEANIARLQAYLDEHKIANRPHIKTHKIPAIAKMQMDAGAIGITCQKVSEAEVMADAGFEDQHQRNNGFSIYSPGIVECRHARRSVFACIDRMRHRRWSLRCAISAG